MPELVAGIVIDLAGVWEGESYRSALARGILVASPPSCFQARICGGFMRAFVKALIVRGGYVLAMPSLGIILLPT